MEIILFNDGIADEIDIAGIAAYLSQTLGQVRVEVKEKPLFFGLSPEQAQDYAVRIAGIKVLDAMRPMEPDTEPLYGEVEYEKRRILGKTRSFGILYDGFRLLRIYYDLIAGEVCHPDCIPILFTNRVFATWDNGDRRYHIRTSLYGMPSVISTTGIIEAPARPREYYLLKQQYESLGRDPLELKEAFRGRFIDYDDERLTEVTKGYALQAVVYALTGDPFCRDTGCRLYNAHWQAELILAQLESEYEFCPRHTALLKNLRVSVI